MKETLFHSKADKTGRYITIVERDPSDQSVKFSYLAGNINIEEAEQMEFTVMPNGEIRAEQRMGTKKHNSGSTMNPELATRIMEEYWDIRQSVSVARRVPHLTEGQARRVQGIIEDTLTKCFAKKWTESLGIRTGRMPPGVA